MGPLNLPESTRKRRWGWLFLWSLLVFAGGIAAGPTITGQAFALVDRVCSMLGISPLHFVGQVKSTALRPTPATSAPLVEPLPSAPEGEGESPAPPADPLARRGAKTVEPVAVAQAPQPRPAVPTAPAHAEHAAVERPAPHPAHAKGETKAAATKSAPAKVTASAEPPAPAPAGGRFHDPFVSDDDHAPQPAAAASDRKPKPSFDEPAPAAKSEPTAKPAAHKSQDSLDGLMADVVADGKGKGKSREGKNIDALLKDVQASKPEPPPKREAPEALPQLSPSDISKVMVGVKMRGKDCAQQLGQKGIAELKLAVSKDGAVSEASVGGKLAHTPLAACVEKAARAASFPRSAGLRFDYRIDLR